MEIVVKKDELIAKVIDLATQNLLNQCHQAGLDEEETNAHLVINRKKLAEEAQNIANIVFVAYGVNEEVPAESAE